MNLLTGKTAIVTGGAGGIGSAISKKLAANGVAVIVTYNSNAGKAQHLLNELTISIRLFYQLLIY